MNKKTKKRVIIAVITIVLVALLYKLFAPECQMQCTQDSSGRYACMPVCKKTSDQHDPGAHGGDNGRNETFQKLAQ